MSQSSICQVSRHSLVHVFPWIQCTGCMHNDHMVTSNVSFIHCLNSVFERPKFGAHPIDVYIMNSYKTLIVMYEISSSAHTP